MSVLNDIWRRMRRQGMDRERAAAEIAAAFSFDEPAGGQPDLETWRHMMTDAQVQAVVQTKRLGVMDARWRTVPASDRAQDRAAADLTEMALTRLEGGLYEVLWQALDALAYGMSIQEVTYAWYDDRTADGWIGWRSVRLRDPALFRLESDACGNLTRLLVREPDGRETALPRDKFVIWVYNRRYAQTRGQSDLHAAWRHWQAKQRLLRCWQESLERYGAPTVRGQLPRNTPEAERRELLAVLERLRAKSALVVPDDVRIDLMEGSLPAGAAFQQAVLFHNREIAKAVLGQTLTTDESLRVGSLALGQVHYRVLQMHLRALRRELAERVLRPQLFRPLVQLNLQQAEPPYLEWHEEEMKGEPHGTDRS